MQQILTLVGPIFCLIGLGFILARVNYLTPGAGRFLAEFGYKVAVPALLFRAMSSVRDVPVSPVVLAAAFVACLFAVWLVTTLAATLILRRSQADSAAIAMAANFGNGVMFGFPVMLMAYGSDAVAPMAFLATLETVVLWTFGTLHMEVASRSGRGLRIEAFAKVLSSVAQNPIILALLLGLAWRSTGLGLPAVPARLLGLLADAAVPVSLFALGVALAGYEVRGQGSVVALLCAIKLVAFPLLALVLVTSVFEMPAVWAGVMVLYAAMPVGANAFLFAAKYDRAVASVSASVAVSTGLALVTVTAVLALLQAKGILPAG
ncbi:MAG TPA: AEC family transporter [Hyphomicrobiaceae bacterium]|nr:AEC family transporter [Hyphomicrobiaceae bacterium]